MTLLIVLAIVYLISIQKNDLDPLSKESTNALRGILAIAIVLHHICSWYTFSSFFASIGSQVCAIFFLLSGYALKVSLNSKAGYVKTIVSRKIPALLLEYGLVFLLTLLWALVSGRTRGEILTSIKSISSGLTFVPFSWFIIAILYFYLSFYLSYRFINSSVSYAILIGLTLLYIAVLKLVGFPDYWYISVPAFPAGVIIADSKGKISEKIKNRFSPVLISLFAIVLLITYLKAYLPSWAADPYGLLINLLWAFAVILSLKKVSVISPITSFLGSISLEIYLIHGFVNNITTSLMDTSQVIWALVQISLSILLAVFLSVLFKGISYRIWK